MKRKTQATPPGPDRGPDPRAKGRGVVSRRGFLASAVAAGGVRALPPLVARLRYRRVLTLVYDKSLGAMRAVDRLIPLP